MKMAHPAALILFVSWCLLISADELSDTELFYVVVVTRHGDRTPDEHELQRFSVGNISDAAYYPYGMGSLTDRGKQRARSIGKYLQNRYDGFLSRIYWPEEIEVRSTYYHRTKMTALLAMASLYEKLEHEHSGDAKSQLGWQPVPYNAEPKHIDPLMAIRTCMKYGKILTDVVRTISNQTEGTFDYVSYLKFLSQLSGYEIDNIFDAMTLMGLIEAQESYGILKPPWAEEWWDFLKQIDDRTFSAYVYNDDLVRLSGGVVLKYFIHRTSNLISDRPVTPSKLLYISGHDNTVVGILAAAKVLRSHRPKYTSTFSLELRRCTISGVYGVTAVYAPTAEDRPELLTIEGCGNKKMCPYKQFVELTEKYIVENYQADCAL